VVSLAISFLLAAYMIATGVHSLITAVFVGSGRPQAESATRIADLVVSALGCWFLVPVYGGVGAAAALLAGKIVAVAAYGALQLARPWANPRRESVPISPCEGQQ
jgi:O-antigen/teichoic acid export membrane protein